MKLLWDKALRLFEVAGVRIEDDWEWCERRWWGQDSIEPMTLSPRGNQLLLCKEKTAILKYRSLFRKFSKVITLENLIGLVRNKSGREVDLEWSSHKLQSILYGLSRKYSKDSHRK